MKLLFENWRKYLNEEEKESLILTEERIEEVFGLQKGAIAFGDPEEGTHEEYQQSKNR